jgi:hypothetical protein
MNATKIRLSQEEAALIMRSDWILTKNRIIQKVMELLGLLQEAQQKLLINSASSLPSDVSSTTAKISKGENYKGLPYLVLDYPRIFQKEQVFAIRVLFWWGHFFSSTLHLTGDYKILCGKKIMSSFHLLRENGFFICINDDPWEHHFEAGNFISLQNITADRFEEIIRHHSFLKLSKKIPLDQWDEANEKLLDVFSVYMELCRA